MSTATVKARRALDRGLACLVTAVAFASPVGSTAARGFNTILSAAGYRYGVTF